jgi:translation initiation factor RLI1
MLEASWADGVLRKHAGPEQYQHPVRSERQIVGVFGANSAGKSTLMYTLSGIMQDIARKRRRWPAVNA